MQSFGFSSQNERLLLIRTERKRAQRRAFGRLPGPRATKKDKAEIADYLARYPLPPNWNYE
jgi:hypothetical protein